MSFIEKNSKFLVCATGAVMLGNAYLMSKGIETMPGMWVPEVYKDPMLGASLGGMTGISIGAVAGVTLALGKEAVMGTIAALKENFSNKSENNNSFKP